MTRPYVKLPGDAELLAMWRRLGSAKAIAAEVGCSEAAVHSHLRQHRLRGQLDALKRLEEVTDGLQAEVVRLERRVHALEERGERVVTIDHRRIADGGRSVRDQIRLDKRLAEV